MTEILGVDAGNSSIKIVGERGEMILSAALGEYRKRKLEQKFSEDDIIYEFKGRKGFAGTLAENESQLLATRMGDSKAHEEMLIRVLLGINKYSTSHRFKIVVGQPISKHTKTEKNKMKNMLIGLHEIKINGIKRNIAIEEVEIASEAGSAFWSNPRRGKVRIIDIGSGTVNAATLNDGKYIDRDSFTIKDGLETILVDDVNALARIIALKALTLWNPNDIVLVCGGGAELLLPHLKEYFYNISLLLPKIQHTNQNKTIYETISPIYANAVGFYNIAKKVFSWNIK